MSNFERVLSDDDLLDVYRSLDNPKRDRDSVIGAMGAAVDAAMRKLAEQEPVAWRINAKHFCGNFTKDKATAQYLLEKEPANVTPLYAHPMPSVSNTSDKTACVSEIEESETQHHLEYIKRYQNWRRGEDKTMSEAGINPNQLGESLDWLIAFAENHIPDSSKTMHPSVSIDEKEVESIVQAYLDNLEGWKLVPKEPSFKRNFYLDCLEIIKEVKE